METDVIAIHLENLDRRLAKVEQILPTLATKDEMAVLATKVEVAVLATKVEMAVLATKEEMAVFATKDEIAVLATKEEMRREIRDEGERSRRHMDIIAEALHSDIRLLAERAASDRSKPR
jgi:hypothetical protein